MFEPAPEGARCAEHRGTAARSVCGRCGRFLCQACERRSRPEAAPLCPACLALRTGAPSSSREGGSAALQTWGLVLGILALMPFAPTILLAPVAVAVNALGLALARSPRARAARWRPALGLGLTALAVGLSALLFYSFRS